MYSDKLRTIDRVLRLYVALMLLGTAAICRGADESISAKLKANEGVGVAFTNIRQGFFSVGVALMRPDDWFIVTTDDSSRVVDKSGETIWFRTSADESEHAWEGCGATCQSWPGVLFAGNLTKDGAGDGEPPSFDASVADIDIDVDSLGLHVDGPTGHWPPNGTVEEDQAKTGDGTGGLYLPGSLVTGSFPYELPTGPAYKLLVLNLRPHWAGTPSYDGNVGTLTFSFDGAGFAVYELTGSGSGTLVSSTKRVPADGFSDKQYAILTNEDFVESGTISARFEWDTDLRGDAYCTSDHVRLAPVETHFVRESKPGSGDFVIVDAHGLPTYLPTDGVGAGAIPLSMYADGHVRFNITLTDDLCDTVADVVEVCFENTDGEFQGTITETAPGSGVFVDSENQFTMTVTPVVTSDTTHDTLYATVSCAGLGLNDVQFTLVEGPPSTVDSLDFRILAAYAGVTLAGALNPAAIDTISVQLGTTVDGATIMLTLTETDVDTKVFVCPDDAVTLTINGYTYPDPTIVDSFTVLVATERLSIPSFILTVNETEPDSLDFHSFADTAGIGRPSIDITPLNPETSGQGVFYVEVTAAAMSLYRRGG